MFSAGHGLPGFLGANEGNAMRLYGKNPVLERIRSNPGSIKKLYLQEKTDLSELVREARAAGVSFESVQKSWFRKAGDDIHTQGVLAEIEDYVYTPLEEVLDDCSSGISTPVFLDGITDPQNFGSIIRTLACLGGFSLVIPEFESVEVTETVLRVASGGENYVKIAKVTNLVKAADKAKEKGISIAGAVVEEGEDITSSKLDFPMVIIVGSEGKGIRPGLRKHLDRGLTLSMKGAGLSFNAAIAAALFAYEITKKKELRAEN